MNEREMSRRQKTIIVVLVLLLILFFFCLLWKHRHIQGYAPGVPSTAPVVPVTAPPPIVKPVETKSPQPRPTKPTERTHPTVVGSTTPLPSSPPTPPLLPIPSSTTLEVPAGQEGMHRELIPRNITIERCYYTEEVVNPGTQFYFEVNGSGFDSSFYRSITVDPDALDIEVRDLKLVTANQIQGLMVVGDAATTQYIYPKILIRGLPVFKAPDPFGVVRHGEVLDIHLTSIDETGQWGKFRIITNLDDALYSRLKVQSTSAHLDISNIKPSLPFYVDGAIEIAPGLTSGSYGLSVLLGSHEIFRKQPLVEVVKPNIGKSGSIESVDAKELAHRPGDAVEFDIEGSGFLPNQTANLSATIDNVQTGPAVFTYVSVGKYTMVLSLPPTITKGVYGLTIRSKTTVVFRKKAAFAIVPADWLSQVSLTQELKPGQSGQLQLKGRDLSQSFLASLRVEADDPGLTLSALHQQDNQTFVCDIKTTTNVTPGDYIIHVYTKDKELRLPRGNIIKITS
jgi:hypothetical protein